jgi:Calcineurin-like phosphoesterase
MAKKAKAATRRATKKAVAKKASAGRGRSPAAREPLRYAHPFFTATPVSQRPVSPRTGTRSMAHFASQKLGPIPPPTRDPTMDLKDIIGGTGVSDIEHAGNIKFHVIGDTGRPGGDSTPQEQVVEAMAVDYDPAAPKGHDPALLLHLGDVIYGPDKAKLYRDEFYRPNMKYPGKIIAIPGNHDGETFAGTDPVSLRDFRNNFCAPNAVLPSIAGDVRIFRETMTQPGVYWMLTTPFANIIGLYSNIAEGPGDLLGANGDDKQVKWLTTTLASLKGSKKALVIATHHPPFSSGGHSPSKEMLAQIDKVCDDAGVVPHAMLAGHAHNYQRYTRTATLAGRQARIPYIVAGCGGHAASAVTAANGQHMGETVFEKSMKGYGYLLMTATSSELTIAMIETTDGIKRPFDSVTVPV